MITEQNTEAFSSDELNTMNRALEIRLEKSRCNRGYETMDEYRETDCFYQDNANAIDAINNAWFPGASVDELV